jgi:hypothetical protein
MYAVYVAYKRLALRLDGAAARYVNLWNCTNVTAVAYSIGLPPVPGRGRVFTFRSLFTMPVA